MIHVTEAQAMRVRTIFPEVDPANILPFEKFLEAIPDRLDMVLFCPSCGAQHIDMEEHNHGCAAHFHAHAKCTGDSQGPCWTNPPHRSHLCATCGHIWRPADVATNGVAVIKTRGKNDSVPVTPQDRYDEGYQQGWNSAQEND